MNLDDIVLVTGASGFIGGHLVGTLATQGRRVRAAVGRSDLYSSHELPWRAEASESLEVIVGDLADRRFAEAALHGVATVVHLAGATGPESAEQGMYTLFDSNVVTTFNLFETARRSGTLERFVNTSTCSVYMTNGQGRFDETMETRAGSVYSATKIASETLSEAYVRSANLPVVSLRLFNVYGPYQKRRAVIPTIVSQALESDRIRLGNTEAKRDFTHVSDIVRCYVSALDAPASTVVGETFNVGTGVATSIGDVARLILNAAGSDIEIEIDPARLRSKTIDSDIIVADNRKAERLLGWRPRIDLASGIEEVVAWWRQGIRK